MTQHTALAHALLQVVRAQDFGSSADSLRGGQPVEAFPSIDLAVIAFPASGGARSTSARVRA